MFVVQLPGRMENSEPGRLLAQCPSNTFGHMYLEAMPALPGDEGQAVQSSFCLPNQFASGSN